MRCARPALIAPVFLGLLASSGCYGPYQQSPYGSPYGGYPGVGGPPIQTLQPGGIYTPGVSPQGTFSQPTPVDPTGGNAPPFYGNGSSTLRPYDGTGGIVPTYDDANEVQFQEPQRTPSGSTADQNVDSWGNIEGISATVTSTARVDLDTAQFVAPVSTVADDPQQAYSAVPAALYAHHTNYHWLRGVLRFDAASRTWTIIYSDTPAAADPHAGRLVVADAPQLAPLKPQAVVLLRGEVDTALSESAGRAIYRVDAVERVDPSLP